MQTKNISLPDKIEEALCSEAERLGVSQSEIARSALRKELQV